MYHITLAPATEHYWVGMEMAIEDMYTNGCGWISIELSTETGNKQIGQ